MGQEKELVGRQGQEQKSEQAQVLQEQEQKPAWVLPAVFVGQSGLLV